jgi:hypothetical protein
MDTDIRVMGKKLNDISRRIKTLDEHIMHSENRKKYRKVHNQYDRLYSEYETLSKQTGLFVKSKAEKALKAANDYCEEHRPELAMFKNAEEYLRDVLQDRYDPKKNPPISMWQEQRAAKIAERTALTLEYKKLKDETQKVEQIKRSVADILHSDTPERTQRKSQGVEI